MDTYSEKFYNIQSNVALAVAVQCEWYVFYI